MSEVLGMNTRQTKWPTRSFQHFMAQSSQEDLNTSPYRNLASAIVCVAADDYLSAMRHKDKVLIKILEDFFNSEWYAALTDLDPTLLVSMLRSKHKRSRHA